MRGVMTVSPARSLARALLHIGGASFWFGAKHAAYWIWLPVLIFLVSGGYGLAAHDGYRWVAGGVVAAAALATHVLRAVEQRELVSRVGRSIADLRDRAVHFEQVARVDPMTGVLSRHAFLEALEAEHRRVRDEPSRTASLLVLDLDELKAINDRFGHHAGDDALKTAARVMRDEVRQPDIVGRLGGDEFAILARGVAGRHADDLADRIRASVSAAPLCHGEHRPVWLSISIGSAPLVGSTLLAGVLELADRDLYVEKAAKRRRAGAA